MASRVYLRWKWTVRIGLFVVPMILFLSGAITYYLMPKRYQSGTMFEYMGERPSSEVVALLKSSSVFNPAFIASLGPGMKRGWMEMSPELISRTLEVDVNPDSGWFDLKATINGSEWSRDLAAGLVQGLEKYENTIHVSNLKQQQETLGSTLRELEDAAEAKKMDLVRLIRAREKIESDPASRVDIAEAQKDWEHTYAQVLEVGKKMAEVNYQLDHPRKWTLVHTPAAISYTPVEQDLSWQEVIWGSLGTGVALALLVPYLLELVFPRRLKLHIPLKTDASLLLDDSEFSPQPLRT